MRVMCKIKEACTALTKVRAVHYITLHYITLHYITLHYITLHYITLHYITSEVLPRKHPYSGTMYSTLRSG